MSAAKYANLPDIDLEGHDVYETPDVVTPPNEVDSDEDDGRRKQPEPGHGEELDDGPLPPTEDSGRYFRHAERRARRQRALYSYPSSTPSTSRSASPSKDDLPLSERIAAMKRDLIVLEAEAARGLDAGAEPSDLMKELSDVRGRLARVGGRARLVQAVVNGKSQPVDGSNESGARVKPEISAGGAVGGGVVEMDRRIAQLEKLVGSSGTSLDESSSLPQPLLPHLTRISTLLTLLTQPRHIDSISRRLKLLLTDLERYNASSGSGVSGSAPVPPALAELAPLLQRLAPNLTTIPAVLARLKTLSALHASAAGFGESVTGLEEDQRRTRAGLAELEEAVQGLESSIGENERTVRGNVEGLETRIAALEERLAGLGLEM
ncbi:dynamitin domain-containing protein [Ceratobasidium sp. AG-Ba]|nr:dynamitin domain-containing protein [Ceratobasidium sp. AG-Ba]